MSIAASSPWRCATAAAFRERRPAAASLTSAGYDVKSVGNVDDGTVYPETLVIYKDEAFEIAAKAIVSDLSAGRVVNGGDFYTFDTNVLVIIGTDWIG